MSQYPKRQKFFAHKFCRLLTNSAAAMEIGSESCWLLTIVVHQEDAVRYSKPITYWNDQLQTLCGFGGRTRLVNARKRAIDSGWLHYEPGDKSKPGKYWVTLPVGMELVDGEGYETDLPSQNKTANDMDNPICRPKMESKQDGKPASFNPNPIPKRKGGSKSRFVPPSEEEVSEYIIQYSAAMKAKGKQWPIRKLDATAFIDYYTSNGWKQSKGNPIECWKSTVRGWGRRDFGDSPKEQTSFYKELSPLEEIA